MENYNQKNFNKTVEIADTMHDVEAKYVKQYYDYQLFRSQEDRVTTFEIISDYKKNSMDTKRAVAYIEVRKSRFRR